MIHCVREPTSHVQVKVEPSDYGDQVDDTEYGENGQVDSKSDIKPKSAKKRSKEKNVDGKKKPKPKIKKEVVGPDDPDLEDQQANWSCNKCDEIFRTRKDLYKHKKAAHFGKDKETGITSGSLAKLKDIKKAHWLFQNFSARVFLSQE